MPTSNIEVEDASQLKEMPEEYRQILVHQLLAHTEGELSGGDNYHLMALHAPNAYERKVIYESAADEMKHYMLGAALLNDMGIDASYMMSRPLAERTHYPAEFVKDMSNWAERGLTSLLAEWAALEQIEELCESSYKPFARICPGVAKEEQGHIAHGFRVTMNLCETDSGRAECQERLNLKWGQVLDLFGRSDSPRSKLFLKWGLRKRSNEAARSDFIVKARAKLASIGLVAPPDHENRRFV